MITWVPSLTWNAPEGWPVYPKRMRNRSVLARGARRYWLWRWTSCGGRCITSNDGPKGFACINDNGDATCPIHEVAR